MESKEYQEKYNRWFVGQEILPRIYLGSYMCALNKDWIKETGITHIISCREVKHSNELAGITYIDVIMYDTNSQKLLEPCETIFKNIEEILAKEGTCILIHCTAGISRSASALIYYIMRKEEYDYCKALDFISGKRPCIGPNGSFANQLRSMKFVIQSKSQS